jgi:hypothetical protein
MLGLWVHMSEESYGLGEVFGLALSVCGIFDGPHCSVPAIQEIQESSLLTQVD